MRTTALLLAFMVLILPASAQQLENAFPSLTFSAPVDIQTPDDGSNRLFVVEQSGRIRVVNNVPSATTAPTFLDIRSRVVSGGELGLLGLAFDPAYAQNGYFYVNYTRDHPVGADPDPYQTVIARYQVSSSNPNQANPSSELILLTVDQPFSNHNAGQLQFGPDGYLYVALGDGGSGGDPQENGQDLTTLLGSMLRLDVDGGGQPLDCAAGTGAATIPADNPFASAGAACDEIYAYGLRNPFRFSFGPDGLLWAGDVGQGEWEEVDIILAGGNYGWDTLEGTNCYEPSTGCDPTGTVFPIYEYPHTFTSTGGFSVIGGYVYTGPSCADLRDTYIYGDFVTRNIWSLAYDGTTATNTTLIPLSNVSVSTFGVDEQGELYLANLGGGSVLRLNCSSNVTVSVTPPGSPIVVPSGGGTVSFSVTLTNTTSQRQAVDAWIAADLSNGAEVNRVLGPQRVTIGPNGSGTAQVSVQAPAGAPSGLSTVSVLIGSYPDEPIDAARFTVFKQPAASLTGTVQTEWTGGGLQFAEASSVSEESTLRAYPNPFSSTTTVHYTLAETGPVRLVLYDVLGREVAALAEGIEETGSHEASISALDLPSGVYILQLDASGRRMTQRLTLSR